MVAIVLAAGYATRLYPLTLNKPKALLEIGGKPMLDHILEKILDIKEIKKTIVVSNGKYYGQFTEWKAAYANRVSGAGGSGIRTGGSGIRADGRAVDSFIGILNDGTVSEETRLGAIGDIKYTVEKLSIDDDLFVIAGDNFFTRSLAGFYGFFKRANADCITVKRETDPELLRRVAVAVLDADSRVIDLAEKPAEPKSDMAVYAAYMYRRDTLPLFKVYLDEGNPKDSPGNFPSWLYKRRTVAAYPFEGDCYDIGTVAAYDDICKKFA